MEEVKRLFNESAMFESYGKEKDAEFTYIVGPFLGAEKVNRNGRIYPRQVLYRECQKFQTLINSHKALGEWEHPEYAQINSKNSAILITELKMNENDDLAYGKARILKNSQGRDLQGLLDSGVEIGVSSRGTGTLRENNYVNDDYELITIDAVLMPSCPDACVRAVNESVEWVYDEKTHLMLERVVKEQERRDDLRKEFNDKLDRKGQKVVAEAFQSWLHKLNKNRI